MRAPPPTLPACRWTKCELCAWAMLPAALPAVLARSIYAEPPPFAYPSPERSLGHRLNARHGVLRHRHSQHNRPILRHQEFLRRGLHFRRRYLLKFLENGIDTVWVAVEQHEA